MDPLTPEEVTALEYWEFLGLEMMIKGCISGSLAEWPMLKHEAAELLRAKDSLIRTIRDRERERDDKEYARKEWAETAHRVIMERDALLGNPEAVHQGALAAFECMKQFEALKAERDELQRKLKEERDWFCQAQRERDEFQRSYHLLLKEKSSEVNHRLARDLASERERRTFAQEACGELQRKLEECERRLNG